MTSESNVSTDQPMISLRGGYQMPALGFGTFQLEPDEAHESVLHALEIGYRHVDTADMYGNHEGVAKALAESNVRRQDIFLVTKIWRDRLRRDDLLADAERSLKELGTDYVDQLLIHWPNSDIPMDETFDAMDRLVRDGKVRTVGVSNFTIGHLEKAIEASPQPIVANQVELHPYLSQPDLRSFCNSRDIAVVAYRPILKGEVNDDDTLAAIADKHGRTAVQVTLRWMLQLGLVTIPRSSSADHIEQNFQALDFELDDEDMQKIDGLNRNDRRIVPDFAEFDGPQ